MSSRESPGDCRNLNSTCCDKQTRLTSNLDRTTRPSKLGFDLSKPHSACSSPLPRRSICHENRKRRSTCTGCNRGQNTGFGWQCLVARRLAERGVRFVELIDVGSSNNWDAHGDMNTHAPLAQNVDQPIAALITDLKQRGMLDDTLVVWTTEFGRTPYNAAADAAGREHHHQVFSSWLAGGGVKSGIVHGSSDEYGVAVAEDMVHVHDFHATILHLLGLDHERLLFRHAGRDYRLTDVHGRVVEQIVA